MRSDQRQRERLDRVAGVLLGGAVGDALGLPREGLSARRARRLFPGPLRHRLVAGRGMISDDTEHACMTAQAILRAGGDVEVFRRSLAWRLRGWLLSLPAAVGFATLRAILRLWIGFRPTRSGVRSAGNGPAMRAAIIGAAFDGDPHRLRAFAEASTLLTHTDARAVRGATLIALAAARAVRSPDGQIDADAFLADAMDLAGEDVELLRLLSRLTEHLAQHHEPERFLHWPGRSDRVGGYMYETMPTCLLVWLRHPGDFRAAVEEVIALGGDTDTTAAIVGALVGATAGADAIPSDWVEGVMEYPRSIEWIRRLADRLARTSCGEAGAKPLPLAWPAILPRNAVFLLIVLLHGLRPLLPPW